MKELINKHYIKDIILPTFERYFEFNLPESYKDFLIRNEPIEKRVFNISEYWGWSDLREVFGFSGNKNLDLFFQVKLNFNRIPRNALPIARVSAGLILLSLGNEDYGTIYFIAPFEIEDDHIYKNTIDEDLDVIADSFEEFLLILQENYPDNPNSSYQHDKLSALPPRE